jgi:hypothetical protein
VTFWVFFNSLDVAPSPAEADFNAIVDGGEGAVPAGAGVTGAGVTGAGVTGAGVTGAGATGAGVTGAANGGAGTDEDEAGGGGGVDEDGGGGGATALGNLSERPVAGAAAGGEGTWLAASCADAEAGAPPPSAIGAAAVSSFGWVIPAPGLARSEIRTVSFFSGTVDVFDVGLGGWDCCSSLMVQPMFAEEKSK